jgi:hypothetical protein
MLLALPGKSMLKAGKFEKGLAVRHMENHEHMHLCDKQERGTWCEKGHPASVCAKSLVRFYLLDLSGYRIAPLGQGGTLHKIELGKWNKAIRQFLVDEHCADRQKSGSESRYLISEPSSEKLQKCLERCAGDIVRDLEPI